MRDATGPECFKILVAISGNTFSRSSPFDADPVSMANSVVNLLTIFKTKQSALYQTNIAICFKIDGNCGGACSVTTLSQKNGVVIVFPLPLKKVKERMN